MVQIINYVKENNISTLLVSHDYEEVVFLSDTILVLSATPTEILKSISVHKTKRDIHFFNSKSFQLYCSHIIT